MRVEEGHEPENDPRDEDFAPVLRPPDESRGRAESRTGVVSDTGVPDVAPEDPDAPIEDRDHPEEFPHAHVHPPKDR
ncbi:hypothetical protein [Bailinhaonella thermotolerans]|uniref:hypothetical protein n=1 Tax=Bailinhaonella thermotolerans TaxID=1070861 RepID=UPI0011C3745E|nr:hypothetical protein [Bailinhaonella thermotolerans]